MNRNSPITPAILFRIKAKLSDTNMFDVLFWAAGLFMFFEVFRKSNLFAKGAFHKQKQFTCDSFILNTNKLLSVYVHRSKTIQHTEREQKETLPAIYPHPLCPATAVCKALQKIMGKAAKPAFPITSAQFDKKLKAVMAEEGNISVQFPPRRGMLGTWTKHPWRNHKDHG